MRKLLILICALSTVPVTAEPVRCPDGQVIRNVVSTFMFFSTVSDLQVYLSKQTGEDFSDTEAYSQCWRNVDENIAYCDIYVAMPQEVDGEHTLSLGHEVLHGVCGDEYHE